MCVALNGCCILEAMYTRATMLDRERWKRVQLGPSRIYLTAVSLAEQLLGSNVH